MSAADENAAGENAGTVAEGRVRWQAINRIFHAAVELEPALRDAFVKAASAGDSALEAEIRELLVADQAASGYLEEPLLPGSSATLFAPLVQVGDTLCARFRLVRAIAEGGMGQVFEAHDLELRIAVALKVIRPEISAVPEVLSRFRQEVLLARSIAHPGVCRTFDINHDRRELPSGEVADVVFLTMELLAGETLAARLKREGALPPDDGLRLAGQIAEALAAAHALGIIHRDIKPSNIMLVPAPSSPGPSSPDPSSGDALASDRAVITDFGLARLDPLLVEATYSALSKSARPMGTLAYMAPEQLDGAPVSVATDLYAFGLVLFEMATGRRAFPSEHLLSGLTQRLTGPPPSPKLLMPDLPAEWSRAIEWCLQVKPSDRPRSAGEVISVLNGARRAPQPRTRKAWAVRIPRWAAAVAALLAVSLSAGAYRFYGARTNANVAPGALVYLTPVRNQTSEHTLDDLTELIEAGLGQSTQINLLDRSRAGDILQQMTRSPQTVPDQATAREIAMRAGAVRVVFATVSGGNGDYRLDLDLQQPDNTPARYRAHWTKSFAWHGTAAGTSIPPELLGAVRDASDWVRHEAGESVNDIARLDVPPEDVTTSSWQALAEYEAALKLFAANQPDAAVTALETAVKIDPKFATAYSRLGDILYAERREAEGDAAYRQTFQVDLASRLTRRERDRLKGIFAADTGDQAAAEASFRDYVTYYENDPSGWFYRAGPLLLLGRVPEAIQTLLRAHELEPTRVRAPAHLAWDYMIAGDLPSAWRWQRWVAEHGGQGLAIYTAGKLHLAAGEYQEAAQSFEELRQSSDPEFRSLAGSLLARVAEERGDSRLALAQLAEGIAFDHTHGFGHLESYKLLDRLQLECASTRSGKGVRAELARAVALNPSPEELIAASDVMEICLADLSGQDRGEIVAALEDLQKRVPESKESVASLDAGLRVKGILLLAQGRWREGLAELERSNAFEPPFANRAYLGRAYVLAARATGKPAERSQLQQNAQAVYKSLLQQSGVLWNDLERLPLGIFAECLEQGLRLDAAHPPDEPERQRLRHLYEGLRGHDLSPEARLVPAAPADSPTAQPHRPS